MSKLSKSEAGKIGAKKFSENCKIRKQEAENLYYQNPKLCPVCNCSISFKKKSITTYCSRRCSSIYNNSLSPKRAKSSNIHRTREDIRLERISEIEKGNVTTRRDLKIYLSEKYGYKCFECLESIWRGKILSLELDHIDGNASNNLPLNLRLLCPNCHSITPTWKGRNKGNGRKSMGLPLY